MKKYISLTFKGLFLATFFVGALVAEEPEALTLSDQWNQQAGEMHQRGDVVGHLNDDGMKEMVISLNIIGLVPTYSNEGQLDYGNPFPCIFFTHSEELMLIHDKAIEGHMTGEELDLALAPHKELMEKDAQPLEQLLEKFYKDTPKENRVLYVLNTPFIYFLIPLDNEIQITRTPEEKESMLELYRAEFARFAEFLKTDFLFN